MIVKNEAGFLAGCLQSVAGLVDEIIIVDTGSTDGTLAIARQFQASIYHFAWQDDFAGARNFGLQHATGDWILHLDADERLRADGLPELQDWLMRADVMLVNLFVDSRKDDLGNGHISRAHRLFRNLPGVCYSGRIHEQISPFFFERDATEGWSDIFIIHLGYDATRVDMQKKWLRNNRLLHLHIGEHPGDAYGYYSLAQNQILAQDYRGALHHVQKAMQLGGLPDDIICGCYNNLAQIHTALGDHEQALAATRLALGLNPEQSTAYLLQYTIYTQTGDRDKQIEALEKLVFLLENSTWSPHRSSLNAYVDPAGLYLNLANRYFDGGQFQQAKQAYQKYLGYRDDNIPVFRALAECHLRLSEYTDAMVVLQRILQTSPDDHACLDRLAWLAIKTQAFQLAIEVYERMLHHDRANPAIVERLASLYYRTGQAGLAVQLLSRHRRQVSTAPPSSRG
jgi:tetratricopeptide (TPR) repeat protein